MQLAPRRVGTGEKPQEKTQNIATTGTRCKKLYPNTMAARYQKRVSAPRLVQRISVRSVCKCQSICMHAKSGIRKLSLNIYIKHATHSIIICRSCRAESCQTESSRVKTMFHVTNRRVIMYEPRLVSALT